MSARRAAATHASEGEAGLEVPVAFYAKGRSGLRAVWTLLHPPYTAMHLSFVVTGAALAPAVSLAVLGATLLAFLLAVGIAAHALDELAGRPLQTTLPRGGLVGAAVGALAAAAVIGIVGALEEDLRLLAFVGAGVFLAVSYNLELFRGAFHGDVWFALAWGGFPAATGAFAQAGRLPVVTLVGVAFCVALSMAQRSLSNPARRLRRKAVSVEGRIEWADRAAEILGRETLLAAPERALRWLVAGSLLLAATLLSAHLAAGTWRWAP